MTDQPTTRDQLIEELVSFWHDKSERKLLHDTARDYVAKWQAAGLLADPELALDLENAKGTLAAVRWKLGTPEGRAVSMHAGEVAAELETLRAKVEELTDFAGEQANARRESDHARNIAARESADLRDERDTARTQLADAREYASEKASEGDVLSLEVEELTAERDLALWLHAEAKRQRSGLWELLKKSVRLNRDVLRTPMPRWDEDAVVAKFGWREGRCGKCGEDLPVTPAERDALQVRLDAVKRWLTDPQDLTPAGQLHQIRAAVQGEPAEPADVHPGRPVLPITDDDFDLLETEEL